MDTGKLLEQTLLFCLLLLTALTACDRPEKEYHFGGKVKTVFSYNSQGQLHGIIKHYDELTKLWKEETWKNGKKQGPTFTYGDKGQINSEVQFVDGQEQGLYKGYYDSGVLRTECTYDKGVLDGPVNKYYKNGVVESEVTYVHSAKNGPETLYYPGGTPKLSAYYTAGVLHCPIIEFYESGAVRSVQSYRNDKIDGVSKEYFESGKIKTEMLFSKGRNVITIEYDEAGAVTSTTENKKDFLFLKKIQRQMPSFHWN